MTTAPCPRSASSWQTKYQLQEQISSVKFLPPDTSPESEEKFVSVASWGCDVQVYDFTKNVRVMKCETDMPVLALAAVGPTSVSYGGGDKQVFIANLDEGGTLYVQGSCIGSHDDSVSSIGYNHDQRLIVSGSWDSKIKEWDTRTRNNVCAGIISTEDKVLCIDVRDNCVAAGMAQSKVGVWDLRNVSTPLKQMIIKDSLNVQCIAILPDQKQFVCGTAEGRVSVESMSDMKSKADFTFKPHVDKINGINHPVNAVSCIEGVNLFLTGGSDGKLRMWDPVKRKLVLDFTPYSNEIAALDTSPSGHLAAVACSYTQDRDLEANQIPEDPVLHVRNISSYESKI